MRRAHNPSNERAWRGVHASTVKQPREVAVPDSDPTTEAHRIIRIIRAVRVE